jgi:hypothetical protein
MNLVTGRSRRPARATAQFGHRPPRCPHRGFHVEESDAARPARHRPPKLPADFWQPMDKPRRKRSDFMVKGFGNLWSADNQRGAWNPAPRRSRCDVIRTVHSSRRDQSSRDRARTQRPRMGVPKPRPQPPHLRRPLLRPFVPFRGHPFPREVTRQHTPSPSSVQAAGHQFAGFLPGTLETFSEHRYSNHAYSSSGSRARHAGLPGHTAGCRSRDL